MVLAANSLYNTTHAMLSEVFDTLRLFIDSMDFSEKNGDGWEVLTTLCFHTRRFDADTEAMTTLLLWMLQLSNFELKTHRIGERYSEMLGWTLGPGRGPGLDEATDLLLNWGGGWIIDVPPYEMDGYTLLHQLFAPSTTTDEEYVSAMLVRGPDLYPLGFDKVYTPQRESPTSLAMYSSRAFAVWLCGLVNCGVDLETFADQELEQNLVVHAGWEKETLLDLFAYDYRPDHHLRGLWACNDCTKIIYRVEVQPYWRHLLERIKQKIDPDNPAQAGSEVGEKRNVDVSGIAEAASRSSDLAHKSDPTGNVPCVNLNKLPSESESEEDFHGYPAMISIRSDCIYDRHELICMKCSFHYR